MDGELVLVNIFFNYYFGKITRMEKRLASIANIFSPF